MSYISLESPIGPATAGSHETFMEEIKGEREGERNGEMEGGMAGGRR